MQSRIPPQAAAFMETMMDLKDFKVALAACGHDATIDVGAYPQATWEAWMTYGVRRWYQDHMNTTAKKLRDSNVPVDGAALFADRDETAKRGAPTGRVGVVRKTRDAMAPYFVKAMEKYFRNLFRIALSYPKDCKKKGEREAWLRAAYDSLGERERAWLDAKVEALWAVDHADDFDLDLDLDGPSAP